ncbi:substrate-binding domain-containing protein [Cellulosimicrobium arenosum]|uniref:Substrate-binding domain-containing protein n=1 Tax=Cellulosimicrobium arenosum TaxID=2708133 RepID=A0A927J0X9_9MICO|nr:substrate-binding domain-containing protein [Cellulosimicrobium arenosum]MBD8079866.1 substrate-binding domain-containing protein [Cellulosimicrobium arenosum]
MKITKKWVATAALATVTATVLTACSTGDTGGSGGDDVASSGGDEQVTVGFSVYDMQYEFFQYMEEGTRSAAEAKGWNFELHDQKSDENEMVTGAQALLDKGVDVLIISPFKPDALGPIVAKAQELDVPVIIDDIGGGGVPYDAIVISDNEDGGAQAAEFMDEQIQANGGSKKVVSITCEPSAVYAARRNVGFVDEIQKLGYDVVTELSGNSKAEEGYKIMKDALAKDPDVAGVFACNDPMGVAAANAIKDSGLSPVSDVVTVGFNGDAEALTAIADDGMSATIAQDPTAMGELTVDLADQAVSGEEIDYDNAEEREVYQPVTLVDADNVADYLQ